jgi:sugar (pentulose or hexulose) kinase
MAFIVMDLGSTFIKGAIADADAFRLGPVRRAPFPDPLPGRPAGFHEVDPEAIFDATAAMLDTLLAEEPSCEGWLLSAQMHGLVLMAPNGTPRSPLITWQDVRATETISSNYTLYDDLCARVGDAALDATGKDYRPGLPVCALHWMARHGALPPPDTIPSSLPDYIIARLAGTAPRIDATLAASQGALDLARGDWHRGVLDALGIGNLAWPPVLAEDAPPVHLTRSGQRFPCYAPVGDMQAALAGTLLAKNELSINIATGSQAAVLADAPAKTAADDAPHCVTRPFFDRGYLHAVPHVPAGLALQMLVDLLCELPRARGVDVPDPWGYIAEAAAAAPETGLEADLAFFPCSFGDSGALRHITRDALAVGPLFRAAFNSMAASYDVCAGKLAPTSGLERIVFSGGLARRQPLLRDMITKRLDLPARFSPAEEEALFGLLVLARARSGRAPSVAAAMREARALCPDIEE